MKVFAPNPIIHGQYHIMLSVSKVGNVLPASRYLQVLFSDSFVVIGAVLSSINLITISDYWIHLSVMFISFVLDCWLVTVLPRFLCKSGTTLLNTKCTPSRIKKAAEKVWHRRVWITIWWQVPVSGWHHVMAWPHPIIWSPITCRVSIKTSIRLIPRMRRLRQRTSFNGFKVW